MLNLFGVFPHKEDHLTKPNFFIIGAPKCGTTSLATWLAQHPNVYMSPVKEPNFFSADLGKHKLTWQEYEMLFEGVTEQHQAIGEASTSYLFSKVAVPKIESTIEEARYIVMVRNPIDMAYAFHEEQLVLGNEHIRDFAKAWALSEERAQGREVTRWCREPRRLDYKSVCRLGEQLQRLFTIVPRERVLVLVLDDIRENPRREYLRVLRFLGLVDDGRMAFPVYNSAKERRLPGLQRAILITGEASVMVKQWLGIPKVKGTGLLTRISRMDIRRRPRPPMPPELRAELAAYFREDVALLSRLLERDFSEWLKI